MPILSLIKNGFWILPNIINERTSLKSTNTLISKIYIYINCSYSDLNGRVKRIFHNIYLVK